jgi:GxxExxY protein
MIETQMTFDFDVVNKIASETIGAALAVHRTIGAGHNKETYLSCWAYELRERGLQVEIMRSIPLQYKNLVLNEAMQLELVVEDCIVLNPLTLDKGINDDHIISLVNKLRYAEIELGLLINFNVKFLRGEAIKRVRI